jgi:hypothetical protein
MRLLLMIILAGNVSVVFGVGLMFVMSTWLPSYDDAAGRGLGEAFMLLFIGVYALVGMIALGLAARRGERLLRWIAILLAVLPAGIVLFAALQALSGRADLYELKKQFFSILGVLGPLESTVAAQWLILRSYLRLRENMPIFGPAR